MKDPRDRLRLPLSREGLSFTLASFIAAAALVGAAGFAFGTRPARPLLPSPSESGRDTTTQRAARPTLAQDGFLARKLLGVENTQPTDDEVARIKRFEAGAITLVAIVGGGGTSSASSSSSAVRKAALYSRSSDQFLLVGAGEAFGDAIIDSVDATTVQLRQGGEKKTLALCDGPRVAESRP